MISLGVVLSVVVVVVGVVVVLVDVVVVVVDSVITGGGGRVRGPFSPLESCIDQKEQ